MNNGSQSSVLLVDGVFGRYIPKEFVGRYISELQEAGFGEDAEIVLNTDIDEADEVYSEAWDNIVNGFTMNNMSLCETPDGLYLVNQESEILEYA